MNQKLTMKVDISFGGIKKAIEMQRKQRNSKKQ